MMHIGCDCKSHPLTTVETKRVVDIAAGDRIISSTLAEIHNFDGSFEQVLKFARRNNRQVTSVTSRSGSVDFKHANGSTSSAARRLSLLVLVTK